MSNHEATVGGLQYYMPLEVAELKRRIEQVRGRMGKRLLILGHHYVQDLVLDHVDLRGDSYQLSQQAAAVEDCSAIVFCGVHFMAETADILVNSREKLAARGGRRIPVILPDPAAGCSMADMATLEEVRATWDALGEVVDTSEITPITYVNSTAGIKAFCGDNGGIACTSSNAKGVLRWAMSQRPRVLFFPDQHLGRNASLATGVRDDRIILWRRWAESLGGNTPEAIRDATTILWQGQCNIHQAFAPEDVHRLRREIPDIRILVHPECPREVNDLADVSGSTHTIIKTIEASPPGSIWAIGTELNLVNRLRNEHPEQEIHFLSQSVSICPTMALNQLPHLCHVLENFEAGNPLNVIAVDENISESARVALQRMLDVMATG
jgi:quinolinate synthase